MGREREMSSAVQHSTSLYSQQCWNPVQLQKKKRTERVPDALITSPVLYVCSQRVHCVEWMERSEAVWGNRDDMREAAPVQDKHKLCHFIWKQWGTGHWVCSHPHLHCLPSSFTPPPSMEHKRGERGRGGGGGGGGGGAAVGAVGVWLCSFSSVCVRMHRRFSSNLMCVPGDIWWIKAKQLHFAAPPDLPLPVPHIKAGVIADLS